MELRAPDAGNLVPEAPIRRSHGPLTRKTLEKLPGVYLIQRLDISVPETMGSLPLRASAEPFREMMDHFTALVNAKEAPTRQLSECVRVPRSSRGRIHLPSLNFMINSGLGTKLQQFNPAWFFQRYPIWTTRAVWLVQAGPYTI